MSDKNRDAETIWLNHINQKNKIMNKESLNPITRTACVVCEVIFIPKKDNSGNAHIPKRVVVIGFTKEECNEMAVHFQDENFDVRNVIPIESYKYKSFSYSSSEQAIDVFIAPPNEAKVSEELKKMGGHR